jgi:hypothetical protein
MEAPTDIGGTNYRFHVTSTRDDVKVERLDAWNTALRTPIIEDSIVEADNGT